jgi:hypothetical protein
VFVEDVEGADDAMGGLEIDAGFGALRSAEELSGAASAFDREKAAVVKAVAWKARADEGGEDGGGAGKNGEWEAVGDAGTDEAMAGVGDARHAGIGNEGDVDSAGEAGDEIVNACGFVVLVEANEGFFDAEVLEEKSAVAGVLCGDEVGGAESLYGSEGDILPVADRSGNDAQHVATVGLPALGNGNGDLVGEIGGGV